jgi:hypothetical protein
MSPAPERRICGLCGRWFILIKPPGDEEAECHKVCGSA